MHFFMSLAVYHYERAATLLTILFLILFHLNPFLWPLQIVFFDNLLVSAEMKSRLLILSSLYKIALMLVYYHLNLNSINLRIDYWLWRILIHRSIQKSIRNFIQVILSQGKVSQKFSLNLPGRNNENIDCCNGYYVESSVIFTTVWDREYDSIIWEHE